MFILGDPVDKRYNEKVKIENLNIIYEEGEESTIEDIYDLTENDLVYSRKDTLFTFKKKNKVISLYKAKETNDLPYILNRNIIRPYEYRIGTIGSNYAYLGSKINYCYKDPFKWYNDCLKFNSIREYLFDNSPDIYDHYIHERRSWLDVIKDDYDILPDFNRKFELIYNVLDLHNLFCRDEKTSYLALEEDNKRWSSMKDVEKMDCILEKVYVNAALHTIIPEYEYNNTSPNNLMFLMKKELMLFYRAVEYKPIHFYMKMNIESIYRKSNIYFSAALMKAIKNGLIKKIK